MVSQNGETAPWRRESGRDMTDLRPTSAIKIGDARYRKVLGHRRPNGSGGLRTA